MEVSRLGVKSELSLLAYTTVTAIQDPSCICNLHHSSQQCQILNPWSEARDWTWIFMDAHQIRFRWATTGTPETPILNKSLTHGGIHNSSKEWNTISSLFSSFYWVFDCVLPSLVTDFSNQKKKKKKIKTRRNWKQSLYIMNKRFPFLSFPFLFCSCICFTRFWNMSYIS